MLKAKAEAEKLIALCGDHEELSPLKEKMNRVVEKIPNKMASVDVNSVTNFLTEVQGLLRANKDMAEWLASFFGELAKSNGSATE